MTEQTEAERLIDRAAGRAGVPSTVLRELLALESRFPDFTIYGAKTDFSRRVGEILNAAAADPGDPS